jgi:hypothetical protein
VIATIDPTKTVDEPQLQEGPSLARTQTSFGPGESFCIANGTPLTWIQKVPVHKIWVIREDV